MFRQLVFMLATASLFFSCKENDSSSSGPVADGLTGVEDFDRFYMQFHTDSAFQMQHISFPLSGLPSHADSAIMAGSSFTWVEEDWKIHRLPGNGNVRYNFNVLNDRMIEEKILLEGGQMAMIRRWIKADDQWMLIYYAGVNRVAAQ